MASEILGPDLRKALQLDAVGIWDAVAASQCESTEPCSPLCRCEMLRDMPDMNRLDRYEILWCRNNMFCFTWCAILFPVVSFVQVDLSKMPFQSSSWRARQLQCTSLQSSVVTEALLFNFNFQPAEYLLFSNQLHSRGLMIFRFFSQRWGCLCRTELSSYLSQVWSRHWRMWFARMHFVPFHLRLRPVGRVRDDAWEHLGVLGNVLGHGLQKLWQQRSSTVVQRLHSFCCSLDCKEVGSVFHSCSAPEGTLSNKSFSERSQCGSCFSVACCI